MFTVSIYIVLIYNCILNILHTIPDAPTFTKTPKDVSDDPGKNVKLECEADGNPSPTYVWFRNVDKNKVCTTVF